MCAWNWNRVRGEGEIFKKYWLIHVTLLNLICSRLDASALWYVERPRHQKRCYHKPPKFNCNYRMDSDKSSPVMKSMSVILKPPLLIQSTSCPLSLLLTFQVGDDFDLSTLLTFAKSFVTLHNFHLDNSLGWIELYFVPACVAKLVFPLLPIYQNFFLFHYYNYNEMYWDLILSTLPDQSNLKSPNSLRLLNPSNLFLLFPTHTTPFSNNWLILEKNQ